MYSIMTLVACIKLHAFTLIRAKLTLLFENSTFLTLFVQAYPCFIR